MRKICRNCGTPANRSDRFCRVCGSGDLVPYDPPRSKGRAIGSFAIWFAIWLGIQTAVTVAFLIGPMVSVFSDPSFFKLSDAEAAEKILTAFAEHINLIGVVYSALFIAAVVIIFAVRQKKRDRLGVVPAKNYFSETGVRGAAPVVCIASVALGAALNRVITFIVDVIPWPGSFVDSFDRTYSELLSGTEPFWLEILCIAVFAPLCEELLFRGIGVSRLRSAFPAPLTVLVTAFVFGAAHGTPIAIAYATVFGAVQAVVFLKQKSILPVVLSHFAFNLTSLLSTGTYGSDVLNLALFFICAGMVMGSMWFLTRDSVRDKNEEGKEI